MNKFRGSFIAGLAKVAAIAAISALVFVGCMKDEDDDYGDLRSLYGDWDRGDLVITFSKDYGVFSEINSGGWRTLQNNGKVRIGDKKFKDIKETGNLAWTSQELCKKTDNTDITRYYSTRITMDADLQTFRTTVVESGCDGSSVYTRVTQPYYKRPATPPETVEDEFSGSASD
jgi:hypothetical protein